MDIKRLQFDLKYIFLNSIVNRIPSWSIRKLIYKQFGMRIGNGARIGIGTVVYCPENIVIGDRSIINENCYLDGRFGIRIDRDVGISVFSKIITGTHRIDRDGFVYSGEEILIRNHAWICANATILFGSTLAEYTVIGAGCVFKGRSNAYDVIAGNPGKVIKKRIDKEDYKINYKPYFR